MRFFIFVVVMICAVVLRAHGEDKPLFAQIFGDDEDDNPHYQAPPLSRLSSAQTGQSSMQSQPTQGALASPQGGQVLQTLPEGAMPMQMDLSSRYSKALGAPRVEPEMPPVYLPQSVPSDPRFVNQSVPNVNRGANVPTGREYYQGVYWPYKYQPYQQGSYWPYRQWPYQNDTPWQGSNFPYESAVGQQRDYATLSPPAGAKSAGPAYTLNEEERAELEMWRRLSAQPIEVTFYGHEAFIKWASSGSRVPIPKDGKIQIKLSPTKQ